MDFGVGDYVLVSRTRGATPKDKTAPIWCGPALVVGAENDLSFKVMDLLSGKVTIIHAEHLRRYADSKLQVTPQLKSFIAASAIWTRVEAIIGHRKDGHRWELRVLWQGFEEDESTWEDLKTITEDVPETVKRYVKTIQDGTIRSELIKLVAKLTAKTHSA